jgi:hypothetical protein
MLKSPNRQIEATDQPVCETIEAVAEGRWFTVQEGTQGRSSSLDHSRISPIAGNPIQWLGYNRYGDDRHTDGVPTPSFADCRLQTPQKSWAKGSRRRTVALYKKQVHLAFRKVTLHNLRTITTLGEVGVRERSTGKWDPIVFLPPLQPSCSTTQQS